MLSAAFPDKSSGLRKALGRCGDCRWLRLRKGLLTATVGVLPKFIPAVDMPLRSFRVCFTERTGIYPDPLKWLDTF